MWAGIVIVHVVLEAAGGAARDGCGGCTGPEKSWGGGGSAGVGLKGL